MNQQNWETLNCCCSDSKSYLALSDLMDCSSSDSSVLHYLSEFSQIHADWASNVWVMIEPVMIEPVT